jgi:hypothetical protein
MTSEQSSIMRLFFPIKFNFSFRKKKIKTDSDEQADVTVTAGRVAEWSVTC